MGKINREISLTVALLLASAGPALAGQNPRPSGGEEVIVTQSGSGEELRGRLVELSPTTMAILVNGTRVDVPVENVLRIDARTDSLKNGAIIGAAIFGGLSAINCPFARNGAQCAGMVAWGAATGAITGVAIDALHKGRTPIYVKAGRSNAELQVRLRF